MFAELAGAAASALSSIKGGGPAGDSGYNTVTVGDDNIKNSTIFIIGAVVILSMWLATRK